MQYRMTGMEKNAFFESKRVRELWERALAFRCVEMLTPAMTFGDLAATVGENLSFVANVMVGRVNYETFPPTLKHPEGRRISHEGTPYNDFGDHPDDEKSY